MTHLRSIIDDGEDEVKPDKRQGGRVTKAQAQRNMRLEGMKAWHGLMVVVLNFLFGDRPKIHGPSPGGGATAAQEAALTRIWEQVKVFVDDKEERGVPRTPTSEWADSLKHVDISYTGEVIQKACTVTLRQILPGLPSPKHVGLVNILELLPEKLVRALEKPNKLVKAERLGPRPRPKVRCHDEEWPSVVKALHDRGLVAPVEFLPTVDDEPTLNGIFGVPKAGATLDSGEEVLRLIIDLRATNWMMHQIEGDTGSLTGAATFQRVVVEEGKELLVSGEDLTSAFYLFRLPPAWVNYLVLDKPVERSLLGLEGGGATHVGLCVLPMGWHSSVGLMQAAHRSLALSSPLNGGAGLHKLSEINRLSEFPDLSDQTGWSIYLDDTTFLEQVEEKVSEELKRYLPVEQEQLRRAYQWWGIPTNEKKSLVRESRAERLGAVIDGKKGILRASTKRDLELMSLGTWIRSQETVDRKVLQIYAGKLAHILQFRRCLFSGMEVVFTAIARGPPKLLVTKELVSEMLVLEALLPLAFFNLKASIDAVVTVSDASETGGGLCYASRLTRAGREEAQLLLEGKKAPEAPLAVPGHLSADEQVLVIDLFAGIGGLGESLRKAGIPWKHLVAVESDPNCRRLLRRVHQGCELVNDITKFNKEAIIKVVDKIPALTGIVVGGGSPCQGLSKLSSNRKHLGDERSKLFYEAVRVLEDVKNLAVERDIWAVRFLENAVADDADIKKMTKALGMEPILVDAQHLSRARRPRLFWLSVTLTEEDDVESIPRQLFTQKVYKAADQEELKDFLAEGAIWAPGADDAKLKFPTMTRPIPRLRPPPQPAGLDQIDQPAKDRWIMDSFRYPPYVYQERYMVLDKGSQTLRPLSAQEREVLMGFPINHTKKMWKKTPAGAQEEQAAEDMRCSALGNSFHTNAVASLFGHCFHSMGLKQKKGAQAIVTESLEHLRAQKKPENLVQEEQVEDDEEQSFLEGGKTDETLSISGDAFCQELHAAAQKQSLLDETVCSDAKMSQLLVSAYIRRMEYRGSDVRLDLGALYRPEAFPRGSVQPNRWKWHVATSYPFYQDEHINVLELRALIHGLVWRLRRASFGDCRALHLTDSQVALAVAVKGRSSSRVLNRLLQKYAALQLAGGVYPLLAWVESEDNPADAPSRAHGA